MMEEHEDSRRISTTDLDLDLVVVDRISALPDFILGDILSLLPTKEAVAASILSKRWKFLWLDLHTLDFDFSAPDSVENMAFIRFVHRVLLLTGAKPLNKFRLDLDQPADIISSHMICWIDAAIIQKVRDITLYLSGDDDFLKLPITGFNCDSLRSLRLARITFVNDMTVVCLPRLETLQLCCVPFTSKEVFEKLINGCPMLHCLKLTIYSVGDDDDDDDAEEEFMYIVSSPSLRHLDMYIEDRCTLELNAPSLEYLKLHGRISEIFAEKSLSSLVEADIDTTLNDHDFHIGAVRALEHAKFLTLSTSVMRALGLAIASLPTKFKRLLKLVSHTDCCCCLQDFVHSSENLEELVTYQGNCLPPLTSDVPHDHSRWTAPVVVPRCLSKTLKKVQLTWYEGLEDEREMIRFMLEHGTALEVMQIHCNYKVHGEKLELLQEICEFPRKSPACKVITWPT